MGRKFFDGRRLRRLRVEAGFKTQEALAGAVRTDPRQISRLESNDTKTPRRSTLERLASVIGCNVDDFFVEQVDPPAELPPQFQLQENNLDYPAEGTARSMAVWMPNFDHASLAQKASLGEALLGALSFGSPLIVFRLNPGDSTRIRLDMSPSQAVQFVDLLNDERLLQHGLVSGTITALGRKGNWTCTHRVGPTLQRIASEVLGWDELEIDPRDSFYYLGADDDEAYEIIRRTAELYGVPDVFATCDDFAANRYALPEDAVPLLAIPLGDVCEHIHRRANSK